MTFGKHLWACVALTLLSVATFAQNSELCEKALGSGSSAAAITCETDPAGRVIISIVATDGGAEASTNFRAKGFDPAGFKYDGENIADYFDRSPANVDRAKQIIYTPKSGVTVEAGKIISFNKHGEGVYVEYRTSGNTNAYTNSFSFNYTYGTSCLMLDAPVITSIGADNVPVFTAVTGATSYYVKVSLNGITKHTQTIRPGQAINFTPLESGTYSVTLTAMATGYLSSPESAPYSWPLTAEAVEIGSSEYCHYQIASGNDLAYLTFETLDNGDVEVLIQGNGDTHFRGNGLSDSGLTGFTVGSVSASTYFTRQYTTGASVFRLHLKNTAQHPTPGEKIRYTGNVEWVTPNNSNAYVQNRSFTYTYGSVCSQLATPTITGVNSNAVPQFTTVEGATNYLIRVYLAGTLKYMQTVKPGVALQFVPTQTGTYQVTVTAEGSGYLDSEESDPADWFCQAQALEVGVSEYCNYTMGSGANRAGITWQTLANGDVEIAISGDEGTSFRANGMGDAALSNFSINSQPASMYFDRMYDGDKSLTYTLHLRDTAMAPAPGEKIRFVGTVEWRTSGAGTAYSTQSYTYTYGSECPHLETPVISNISSAGVITFAENIEGATSYRVNIYRGELLVYSVNVQNGGTLGFEPLITYPYTVTAQAVGAAGLVPSAVSQPYIWLFAAEEQEQPMSSLCDRRISSDDGGVIFNMITDSLGTIVITISGPAHPVWRAGAMQVDDQMKVCGYPITNYFTKSFAVGDTVMYLIPKGGAKGVIITGDKITYAGNVEWSVQNASGTLISRWVTNLSFTYLYGTDCNPVLTRLNVPADLAVTAPGQITFSPVENAASYQVRVEDAERDVMTVQPRLSGDTIQRAQSILYDFTYYVSVRAVPASTSQYRPSLWSNEVEWVPSYLASQDPSIEKPDDPEGPDSPEEEGSSTYPPVVFPDDAALEDIVLAAPVGKFIYRGEVYIFRYGHIFTILGQRVL